MTNKLYDELYPKLNSLIGIQANYNDFYKSWWAEKCLQYSGDKLSNYYDIFFSRFVTYNSLYNTIVYVKERFRLIPIKHNKKGEIIERGDSKKATTEMVEQLDSKDFELFLSNYLTSKHLNEITALIESKKFSIVHKGGQPSKQDDNLLLSKLKNPDNKQRFLGTLELLYSVRCNLFHGNKGYQTDQILLLKPLNEILFSIVEIIYDSYNKMIEDLISDTENEIKLIEAN